MIIQTATAAAGGYSKFHFITKRRWPPAAAGQPLNFLGWTGWAGDNRGRRENKIIVKKFGCDLITDNNYEIIIFAFQYQFLQYSSHVLQIKIIFNFRHIFLAALTNSQYYRRLCKYRRHMTAKKAAGQIKRT